MRVAVVGGTGKTGRAVAAALAERGVPADLLGRAAWDDLPGALRGADAAYVIAPNLHPDEPAYVAEVVTAARTAGVDRLVLHSVASPYVPAMPHHLGKARAEDVVRRSGPAWTILQPGAYLQNLDLRVVRGQVVRDTPHGQPFDLGPSPIRIAYSADAVFGFADLADVGRAAAVVLTGPGHLGATYELASRTATVSELAAAAGVQVAVVTPEQWARTDGAALEPRAREWLLAMFAYYDAHGLPVGTIPMRTLLGESAS